MKPHVCILFTGGTIDSYFDPKTEAILVSPENISQNYLEALQLRVEFSFKNICKKDSREIEDEHRLAMLQAIEESPSQHFLILHGTYTMPDTGKFLKKHSDRLTGKTVVLTGSMKPLKSFTDSDAPFNLGFALSSCLFLPAGVYVSMNGENFDPVGVIKNLKKGAFEPIDPPTPL